MVETIFRVLLIILILTIVLAVLGTVSLNYDLSFSSYVTLFKSFLSCVCYIIPFRKLLPIFAVVVGFVVFKMSISILKMIWQLFPLSG